MPRGKIVPGFRGACHRAALRPTRWLIRATLVSPQLDIRLAHYLAPLFHLLLDEGAEFFRRVLAEFDVERLKPLDHVGMAQRRIQARIELVHDRGGGAGPHEYPGPFTVP